jgi:hypothetical protein
MNGTRYQPVSLTDNRFWLEEIEMGLGLWQGSYQNTEGLWLRWYNADGWSPTLAEKAENERQRADKLAEYLRSLGVDPDTVIN